MASSTYSPLYFQFQAAGPKGLITGRVWQTSLLAMLGWQLVDRLVNTGTIASLSDAVTHGDGIQPQHLERVEESGVPDHRTNAVPPQLLSDGEPG
ncbi:MAG: hypothetical protein R2688_04655 [Fimbriimonadaceae bacterium]